MGQFYRAMSEHPMAAFLLEARRAMASGRYPGVRRAGKGKYLHPYYWAPFVLVEG